MLTKKCSCFSGIPNAALFFSANAAHETKKESVNEQSDDDFDGNDIAEDMRSQLQSQVDRLVGGNVENTEKTLHPAIFHWIALTTTTTTTTTTTATTTTIITTNYYYYYYYYYYFYNLYLTMSLSQERKITMRRELKIYRMNAAILFCPL